MAIGHPSKLELVNGIPDSLPANTDVYFTPALRDTDGKGTDKSDVVGTRVVWLDVDDDRLPRTTLPPSCVVRSGHGFHVYWFLEKPIASVEVIESVNKALLQDVPTGDKASWNANRVLRVPGSVNSKPPTAAVILQQLNKERVYTAQDFHVLAALDRKARHKIKTGDRRGYKSRSERDWAVITALVSAGAGDALITLLFETQPVGDKVRSAETHDSYLPRTIERARGSFVVRARERDVSESEQGYFVHTKTGKRRVSTFTISPKLLLDGSEHGAEDAIVGDVSASGYTWTDKTFSKGAFTTVRRFDAEAPVAAWQWMGNDMDLRKLLPYLMEELVSNGLPRVVASPVLGLHIIKNAPYFLGDSQTLSATELWNGYGGPAAWLPNKREHPELELTPKLSTSDLQPLRSLVPLLNEPEAIWPMLGWYAASPLKPWLEKKGFRFPVLNVTGSRGSGKTTLIQRVMMPMFGQKDPKSYDAGTTRFVTLSLLGSTNAIPIAFSEFRYDSVDRFLRFVLLSYDTGHDPRGRPDQTTVDYPLTAPFSLDGEDIITDPAAQQRIVVVLLTTRTIDEGSESYNAYNEFRSIIPPNFGGYYIQRLLAMMVEGELTYELEQAKAALFHSFPSKLPDRVRNNHIVSYFGMRLWSKIVEADIPDASVMERSIKTVYDTQAGRGRMLCDDLVEDIVNECAAATHRFKWDYEQETNVLYFQLSTAHSWWLEKRRRQGRGALERDSLRQQLKEVAYSRESSMRDQVWMYGVHLPSAREVGLDVPKHINVREIKVKF